MRHFCLLLFFISCVAAKAAIKITDSVPILNHSVSDTDTVFRKQSFSVGAAYGSDVLFFGRTGPYKYPFLSVDGIYNSKKGFFAYTNIIQVLGYSPFVDEIDLGAGYLYHLSKSLSGTIGYTRFLFNKDAALIIKSASTNDINFKNTFDWKFAKSSMAFDYLFGDANDYFITFNTSKHIETAFGIFDDKDYLSITPTVSAIFGTQNFVGKYSADHMDKLLPPNVFFPDDGDFPRYNNGRFTALNYSFKIPFAYNRPHYTIEAAWKYSIPVNVEGDLKNRHEVFFNLTFFYLFY